ncbi:MAG: ABC transporter permease [bacterium]
MNYLFKLALRNIGRNRRRSFLAITSVTLSIGFIIFIQGMIGGMMESMVKNYTKNETGHIRIAAKAFEDKYRFYPITENLEAPAQIISAITDDAELNREIDIITPRINFGVLLSNQGNNKTAVALAGNAENEKKLLFFDRSILPGGRYLENEREIVMGNKIAEALKHKVGDTVKVMTQGCDDAPAS